MSKKTSETLKQQKKARQDFLELKKMQSGEIETGPKPSEVAIIPKTPTEKLKNFWFYNKIKIIAVSIAVIFFAFAVSQCVNRVDYDLKIVLFAYSPVLDQNTDAIADYFESICEDVNGDGEVNVSIVNCSYDKKNKDNTKLTKLQTMIVGEPSAMLYITDNDSIHYFDDIREDDTFFSGSPKELGEDFYNKANIYNVLPENLIISIRNIDGTEIAKNKETKTYYSASEKLLDKIK